MRGFTAEFKVAALANIGTPKEQEDVAFVRLVMDVPTSAMKVPDGVSISNATEYNAQDGSIRGIQKVKFTATTSNGTGGKVVAALDMTTEQLTELRDMIDKALELFDVEARALGLVKK